MNDFKIGDYVFCEDWLFGEIVAIFEDGASVEFETSGGGGTMFIPYDRLRHAPPEVSLFFERRKHADCQ